MFVMTKKAYRNYIKPVFRSIALVVMIFFCLFTTSAFQSFGRWQLTSSNSVSNSSTSFYSERISATAGFICLALLVSLYCQFSFFGFLILSYCSAIYFFSFFSQAIILNLLAKAGFALILIAIFSRFIFPKFQNRFDLLALGTFFGYDLFRHDFLLVRRLCLEPFVRPVRILGSLYSKGNIV